MMHNIDMLIRIITDTSTVLIGLFLAAIIQYVKFDNYSKDSSSFNKKNLILRIIYRLVIITAYIVVIFVALSFKFWGIILIILYIVTTRTDIKNVNPIRGFFTMKLGSKNIKELFWLPVFLITSILIGEFFLAYSFSLPYIDLGFDDSTTFLIAVFTDFIVLIIFFFMALKSNEQVYFKNLNKYKEEYVSQIPILFYVKISKEYGIGMKYSNLWNFLKDPYILYYNFINPLLIIFLGLIPAIILSNKSSGESTLLYIYGSLFYLVWILMFLRIIFINKSKKFNEYICVINFTKIIIYVIGWVFVSEYYSQKIFRNIHHYGQINLFSILILINILYLYYVLFKIYETKVYFSTKHILQEKPLYKFKKFKNKKLEYGALIILISLTLYGILSSGMIIDIL